MTDETIDLLTPGTTVAYTRPKPKGIPSAILHSGSLLDDIDGLPTPWSGRVSEVQGRWIAAAGHGPDDIWSYRAIAAADTRAEAEQALRDTIDPPTEAEE
jgi:hypothetical protein